MKELWNRFLLTLMFDMKRELKPFQADRSYRYWQITIIARDSEIDPESGGFLTHQLIEHGFKINPLPLHLEVHDVEAVDIGKPFNLLPRPEDF